jgi:hypothetical protein
MIRRIFPKIRDFAVQEYRKYWLHYIILIVFIAAVAVMQGGMIKDFKQLPSPIFGGDYYYQMGCINSIRYSHDFLNGISIPGAPAVYLPLYGAIVAVFAGLFSLTTVQAMLYFSIIISISSIILYYILGREIFDNELALLLPLIAYPMMALTLKYSPFTQQIMFPLFLIFIFRLFFRKFCIKNAAFLGIVIGLTGLSHTIIFIEFVLIFCVFAAHRTFSMKPWKKIKDRDYRPIKDFVVCIAVVGLIATAIAMIYWYKPIFQFGGKSTTEYTHWNAFDLSTPVMQIKYLFSHFIWNGLLLFFDSYSTIVTLAALFGVFCIIFMKNRTPQMRFIGVLLVAYIIVKCHYLITENLFYMNFAPDHMPDPARPLLAVLGFGILVKMAFEKFENEALKSMAKWVIIAVIFLVLISQVIGSYRGRENSWNAYAKTQLSPHFTELGNYIDANTNVNDVILTTNELGFAVNALTGRKLVVGRRAHNGGFLDLDQNNRDAAIILYGNDDAERLNLIKRYNIKYVYWDFYWVQSEYQYSQTGQLQGMFDPLAMIYSKDYEDALKNYNISYTRQVTWIDPALKADYFKKLDILFVSPENYRNAERPWGRELDAHLKEIWSYKYTDQSGAMQKIAVLYQVVY